MNFLAYIGRGFLSFLQSCGKSALFLKKTVFCGLTRPYYGKQIRKQLMEIGFYSLPVIGLTSIFTGIVLALQSYTGFSRFSAQGALPTLVVLCVTRELGPVIAALMFSGRVGATIAAEIATMKVTEQIDALSTLSTCVYRYLYWPRILAGLLTLPLLVFIADVLGVFGGFLIAVYQLGFNAEQYLKRTVEFLTFEDVSFGLIKAAFFGVTTALMGCYQGANAKDGAAGVGRATMNAVVYSSIAVMFLDYLLTTILFHK
ncbi:ABC transporter permease [Alphaproteobacteria bacterium]|nr:ABC transporter permease [Alphaproteobacteria bacterium]GHS96749.1 ABC transporter permease [Alphaproteobacteria bacterium]